MAKGIQLATLASLASFALLYRWHGIDCRLTASPTGRVADATTIERGALPTRLNEAQHDATDQGSLQGLSTFLTRWEMNDLLFMIVEENIRPIMFAPPSFWFVVVPDTVRQSVTGQLAASNGA